MATARQIVFNIYKGERAFTTADVRLLLLKDHAALDNITGDEDDVAEILAITNVDECDFTNYARQSLANESETINDTDNRAEWGGDNITISNAGGATNNDIGGWLWYAEGGGTDGTRIPIALQVVDPAQPTNGGNLVTDVSGDIVRSS